MFSVALTGDTKVKGAVASAVHGLLQGMAPFNPLMLEAGCIALLHNFLECPCPSEVLADSLSSMHLLSMDPDTQTHVLGLVSPLLRVVRACVGAPSALASRILQRLLHRFEHHALILKNHPSILSDLFDALKTEDTQTQGCISKMLVYLSASSTECRDAIIREESRVGSPLLLLLQGPSPPAVLLDATCIVANLATQQHWCGGEYVSGLCALVPSVEGGELLAQLGRGLANFAEKPENAPHMLPHLSPAWLPLLDGPHGCRALASLLSHAPGEALRALSKCPGGLESFVASLFDLPGIGGVLHTLLLRKASRLSVCQQ